VFFDPIHLFKRSVLTRRSHGVQGKLDRASKQQLENEFGTKTAEDAVQVLLEKGTVQESKSAEKQGDTNESNAAGAR
jgi:hypothetical protein